jgi:hypothetical protein
MNRIECSLEEHFHSLSQIVITEMKHKIGMD